jgi:hypothetical protein
MVQIFPSEKDYSSYQSPDLPLAVLGLVTNVLTSHGMHDRVRENMGGVT